MLWNFEEALPLLACGAVYPSRRESEMNDADWDDDDDDHEPEEPSGASDAIGNRVLNASCLSPAILI